MSELVNTMIDGILYMVVLPQLVGVWWALLCFVTVDQDEEEAQEIPLPNVKSTILAKIIDFAKYYRTEPMNPIEKVCIFT